MDLRRAVSKTTAYASFFNYPISHEEIHRWLITSQVIPLENLKPYLSKLKFVESKIRSKLNKTASKKILYASKALPFFRIIPGLRLVAITGSVAAKNTKSDDDIDLLFVTAPHSLWIVRPLVMIVLILFFHRRYPGERKSRMPNAFCPNLWLDANHLSVPSAKRSLYSAHELLQIIPILDKNNTYNSLIKANSWTRKYLANAYANINRSDAPKTISKIYDPGSEIHYLFLAPLNYLLFLSQLIYMHPKKTTEKVSLHSAFLHTTDFASKIENHLAGIKDI